MAIGNFTTEITTVPGKPNVNAVNWMIKYASDMNQTRKHG